MTDIRQLIITRRADLGWSMRDLADRAGVSLGTVRDLLGSRDTGISAVQSVADAMGGLTGAKWGTPESPANKRQNKK